MRHGVGSLFYTFFFIIYFKKLYYVRFGPTTIYHLPRFPLNNFYALLFYYFMFIVVDLRPFLIFFNYELSLRFLHGGLDTIA